MSKLISIIIPYYKEPDCELFPLLISLSHQMGVDYSKVECLLVNDGAENELQPEFLAIFKPLDCRLIVLPENRGPGVARQAGIDAATGDYLLFCDADDALYDGSVLKAFMLEAEKGNDIVTSVFLEERLDTETCAYRYAAHSNEVAWMHGKLIRRQYLIDNNIRFHPELRIHEDSYFLTLAFSMTERINHMTNTTYVWKHNENSLTRSNGESCRFTSHQAYIDAIGKSFDVLSEKAPNAMCHNVIQFMCLNYFIMQNPAWVRPPADSYREPAERAFGAMIMPYFEYYRTASPEFIKRIYNTERAKHFADCTENETFDFWLERVTATS